MKHLMIVAALFVATPALASKTPVKPNPDEIATAEQCNAKEVKYLLERIAELELLLDGKKTAQLTK